MATLHIINASSDRRAAVENCLQAASPGDTVLLIGNGVFWAVATVFRREESRSKGISWSALAADVVSRGISEYISAKVQQIDDGAFVDLVASHNPIVSWS
jgi:sulfur relay protein TusB/DsrH